MNSNSKDDLEIEETTGDDIEVKETTGDDIEVKETTGDDIEVKEMTGDDMEVKETADDVVEVKEIADDDVEPEEMMEDVVVFEETADDNEILFKNPRKNLFDEFSPEKESSSDLTVDEELMKVYLRIRPFTENERNQNENQNCLEVQDHDSILAHAPKDSSTYKNFAHGLGKTMHKFTFSQIFKDTTTQRDLFTDTILGRVKDCVDGQNCLVFTYGLTNSGKTYTIQGRPKDAGMVPRALDVLFNSISGKLADNMRLKPNMFTDVIQLTPEQEVLEKKTKEKTLKLSNEEEPDVMSLLGDDASDLSRLTCSTSSSISDFSYFVQNSKESLGTDDIFEDVASRVREETAVSFEDQGKAIFSIWVSFAEIYNEQIFDLLVPLPKKKNSRRLMLKLSEDRNGSPYIKGLREINVSNADEAYRLLTIGQQNLRTACTKLNHQSSRSHCIFNMKIVRVADMDNPNLAQVSILSFCDLAGSERYSKTQSTGDRLKEAGNINSSLLTLGRCIETLRFNQNHKDKPKIIPFRESKLTRLLQNYFCGRGKAVMIVNVNQCASMFDETLNVLKFSAVAKQVQTIQKPPEPFRHKLTLSSVKPSLAALDLAQPPSMSLHTPGTDWERLKSNLNVAQNVPLPDDSDDDLDDQDDVIEELIRTISVLHAELKIMRKEKFLMESKIREEVCKELGEQIGAMEKACNERVEESERMNEDLMERRIEILMEGLAKQNKMDCFVDDEDEWVSSVLLHQEKVKVEEKEKEVQAISTENESMKMEIQRLKKENRSMKSEMDRMKRHGKSRVQMDTRGDEASGEFGILATLTQQLHDAKDKASCQEEEIEKLNEILDEAGETFAQNKADLQRFQNRVADLEQELEDKSKKIKSLLLDVEGRTESVSTPTREQETCLTEGGNTRLKVPEPQFARTSSSGMSSIDLIKKRLDNSRVLQIKVTPLTKKIRAHHTKTSLLRLQNSPAKDPTRGRECMKPAFGACTGKENVPQQKVVKRKLMDIDLKESVDSIKKRRVTKSKKRQSMRKSLSRVSGAKYNLRTRR